jgi:LDH2 family malate/lactate/ureidoglycolate dehydrogenase
VQRFQANQLKTAVTAIFLSVGTPQDIAEYMAGTLVESNLMGHDSHGVIRVPFYVKQIQSGVLTPGARPEIMKETPTTAVVAGKWAFGQVTARYGAEVAIRKAKDSNVAAVGLVQLNHIGRLGEFAAMMASSGMIGMVITGGWRPPIAGVTPYGGAGRALGTNPYSFAVPADKHGVVLLDFATTVMAEGKLQVARAKKAPVPLGVVLDKEGNPSTEAEAFYSGGVMLPFANHKGYAMSLVADLVGGLLPGGDTFMDHDNQTGTMLIALNAEAFRPLLEFTGVVDNRLDEIKAVPPAPGFQEVLIPGEPEARTMAQRSAAGIELPDATWEAILKTAEGLGLNLPAIAGLA